jgi:hypothetical protein
LLKNSGLNFGEAFTGGGGGFITDTNGTDNGGGVPAVSITGQTQQVGNAGMANSGLSDIAINGQTTWTNIPTSIAEQSVRILTPSVINIATMKAGQPPAPALPVYAPADFGTEGIKAAKAGQLLTFLSKQRR